MPSYKQKRTPPLFWKRHWRRDGSKSDFPVGSGNIDLSRAWTVRCDRPFAPASFDREFANRHPRFSRIHRFWHPVRSACTPSSQPYTDRKKQSFILSKYVLAGHSVVSLRRCACCASWPCGRCLSRCDLSWRVCRLSRDVSLLPLSVVRRGVFRLSSCPLRSRVCRVVRRRGVVVVAT